jgi:hypothetical protein
LRTAGRCDGGSVQRSDPLPRLTRNWGYSGTFERVHGHAECVRQLDFCQQEANETPTRSLWLFSVSKWRTKHDAPVSKSRKHPPGAVEGRFLSASHVHTVVTLSQTSRSHPSGAVGGRFVSRRNEAAYVSEYMFDMFLNNDPHGGTYR